MLSRAQKVAESLFAKYIKIALATFASSMIRLAMMWLAKIPRSLA
jgi:hypothetical protein